jgi:hypothetical protein
MTGKRVVSGTVATTTTADAAPTTAAGTPGPTGAANGCNGSSGNGGIIAIAWIQNEASTFTQQNATGPHQTPINPIAGLIIELALFALQAGNSYTAKFYSTATGEVVNQTAVQPAAAHLLVPTFTGDVALVLEQSQQ